MDPQTIPQLNPKSKVIPAAPQVKKPNWFIHFSENVGHAIVDVFKWAPTVANKVIFVLEAESKLTPEFLTALKTFITDGALVAGSAAGAVANKGVNPTLDVATFEAVEKLVKDFTVFYPVLQAAVGALEGHVPTSAALPGTVTATESSATTASGVSVEPTANLQKVADELAGDKANVQTSETNTILPGETLGDINTGRSDLSRTGTGGFIPKIPAKPVTTDSGVLVNETPSVVESPEDKI